MRKEDHIAEVVHGFPTKHPQGFLPDEIEAVFAQFKGLDRDKAEDALMGCTCLKIGGQLVIYHCDVELAVRCGVERRNPRPYEID